MKLNKFIGLFFRIIFSYCNTVSVDSDPIVSNNKLRQRILEESKYIYDQKTALEQLNTAQRTSVWLSKFDNLESQQFPADISKLISRGKELIFKYGSVDGLMRRTELEELVDLLEQKDPT